MRSSSFLVLAVGLMLALLAIAAPEAAAQKKKKAKGMPVTSPLDAIGRPTKFALGQPARYAVWCDNGIWEVRVTSAKGERAVFQGRVDVDQGTLAWEARNLEKAKDAKDGDWVRSLPKDKGLLFQIVTVGEVEGFTLKASPETKEIAFQLRTNEDDDPKHIFIGAGGKYPEKSTFTFPAHLGKMTNGSTDK